MIIEEKFPEFCVNEMMGNSYEASIMVLKFVVPFLADEDETKLRLMNMVKRIPCMIASYPEKNTRDQLEPELLVFAAKMCREVAVILSYCRDLNSRFVNSNMCEQLIKTYKDISGSLERYSSLHTMDDQIGEEECAN